LVLAACQAGDTLVVTKLERLARSLPDAGGHPPRVDEENIKLNLGGSIHDPTAPLAS
jgi:DNA invertase Pin-like site-specific DNA recombinase